MPAFKTRRSTRTFIFFPTTLHTLHRFRPVPLFLSLPPLILYSLDLSRFLTNPIPSSKAIPTIDGLALTFVSLSIIWVLTLVILGARRYFDPKKGLVKLGLAVDIFLWAGLLAMGDTTLALRSSAKNCARFGSNGVGDEVWECDGGVMAQMRAAGALMIIEAACFIVFWVVDLHAWIARRGVGRFRAVGGAKGEEGVELARPGEREGF